MSSEYDFNTVMARLKLVTKTSSDSDLSALLGISSSAFANFKKRNSIPYDRVFAVTNSLNISFDWVFTGKGGMYRTENNEVANDTTDKMSLKMAELFADLNDAQKRDVLSSVEEKKRLNSLEKTVNELQQKVG